MTLEAPIEIVPYDSAWPARFDREASVLRPVLAPWLSGPIEHIGSTAIPGLAAKPVIDIMAGVHTLEQSRPAIVAATAVGYSYSPYQAELEHWFCKPSRAFRTHHLHLVPEGTPQWLRPIAFRDYLRSHAGLRVNTRHSNGGWHRNIPLIVRRTRKRSGHLSTGSPTSRSNWATARTVRRDQRTVDRDGRSTTTPGGVDPVADRNSADRHVCRGRRVGRYMTEQEQQQALADAGFANVHVELAMNGLILYAGERTMTHGNPATTFW